MNFFAALFAKPTEKPCEVRFPTAEALHDERVSWLENLKPWVVVMILAVILAYVPPLYQILSGKQLKAPPYSPANPTAETGK